MDLSKKAEDCGASSPGLLVEHPVDHAAMLMAKT